jgi:hypothetical protein
MNYLARKMDATLETLLAGDVNRPVLVQGARRCGKSSTIEHVCRGLEDRSLVKLDFQTDLETISSLFDVPTDDVDAIVGRISEYVGEKLDPATSILFFDEVQLCEKALNSLRFFSGSRWKVVASGSLLGVATKSRTLPYPSGVRHVTMHPMDFEEWLWANGRDAMAGDIRAHASSCEPYVLHDAALELFDRYLVVGGMPLAVSTYVETGSFEEVGLVQEEIDATYTADMTDPAAGISGISAKRIWDSLPKQLLRASTKKFKYADVVRGGRRERLLEPLEWLAAAGIVTVNHLTCDHSAPLAPFRDDEGSYFKVYVADTGIMFRKFGIDARVLLDPSMAGMLSSDFRGALAENYVSQQLVSGGLRTFYWMPRPSVGRGELDFLFQTPMAQVVPVEVKSGRNVSARSMQAFMEESCAPRAIRLSRENFSRTDKGSWSLDALPLYAAFAIPQLSSPAL